MGLNQEIPLSSVIDLKEIKKNYYVGNQTIEVLKGIDLTITTGELVSIMGASGAGKSTLMNIIGLLDKASYGKYYLDEEDITLVSDDKRSHLRNEKIGFIFQSFFLLPRLTAMQNVLLPILYHSKEIADITERANGLLAKVGMLDYAYKKPNQLSGGQQQRVAIARSLICSPSLILADEPTGALDSKTSKEVMELFIQLNEKEQSTIIIVTHDPNVAKQCKRVITVKDGMVLSDSQ